MNGSRGVRFNVIHTKDC